MLDRPSPDFQTLFEASGLPRWDLPGGLEQTYGGFGLAAPVVYGNFVASLDGIVAIPGVGRSSALISGSNPADRFVVGLLRAAADAIVIGAGTFRAHDGPWTAENAYPDATEHFVDLRRRQSMGPHPTLVVVTASGNVGDSRSKLQGTIVVTTSGGAHTIGEAPAGIAEVVELSATGSIDVREVIRSLSERGYRRILMEGGPTLMGESLKARIVNELFLTVSPVIAGGGEGQPRPTLAAGVDVLPAAPLSGRLLSVRQSDAYLFLRYSLANGARR
ncbi:MAG TPA: dihydrofolate reductase family protein [Actinomycetota bacterium]|jgi:riboflavin biosynthesis pyrimidine reductase|nr:dihydrofolate reductase family protein [Actinomycetota bacterium]